MKERTSTLLVEDLPIAVTRRRMKSLRMRVCPHRGDIKVSAPHYAHRNDIHQFIMQHLDWAKSQRDRVLAGLRLPSQPYRHHDPVPLFDAELRIELVENTGRVGAQRVDDRLRLYQPANASLAMQEKILWDWYRGEIKKAVPPLLERYEWRMGVQVNQWGIKRMKTRWGSCNIDARRIWLNLELARRPLKCLEYVIVHELAHLLEAGHNRRFWGIVEKAMPEWRLGADILK